MPTRPKGHSHGHLTKVIGPSVRILQLNIEGISGPKCEFLGHLAKEHSVDIICLQETHVEDANQLLHRATISGYQIVAYFLSKIYGSITYIKSNYDSYTAEPLVMQGAAAGIEIIKLTVAGTTFVSVYKPPNSDWPERALPNFPHPAVYVGDFNSRHNSWGYSTNNSSGENLLQWAETNNTYLVYDAKDNKTFHSARWKVDTNPDLCFVTCAPSNNEPLALNRKVLGKFPHSQHRPSLMITGAHIPIVKTAKVSRWNFRRARWQDFSEEVDSQMERIPPIINNYMKFVNVVSDAAKKCIPRGFRNVYIPCWTVEMEQLYREFGESEDPAVADEILRALNEARGKRWREATEGLDFTHSSRKGWSLLRHLGAAAPPSGRSINIDPNEIANRLQNVSNKVPVNKSFARQIKNDVKKGFRTLPADSQWSSPFTIDELDRALCRMKTQKAPGPDNIFPEFLKNLGCKAKGWLTQLFSNILDTGNIPNMFRKTKILAILKPGKPSDNPSSYRPIALLSMSYKLLERVIYNRICHTVDASTIPEQAGFRPGRSCCDQALAFSTYIEAGFQRGLKTAAAFIDLSSAYDTVWKKGMVFKLQKVIPCRKISFLIQNMLSNRRITVCLNNQSSTERTIKNGLPQGSVLAPLLFNIYTNDVPQTKSRKFIYADDLTLGTQHKNLEAGSSELTADLACLHEYYTRWRLIPNPTKTEVSAFHLSNRQAKEELNVLFGGKRVRHNFTPTYLGVTFDRSLTFNQHLSKCAQKIKSRNNMLHKLTGTSWGANASTLRTAAQALVYSTAEYCAPIWCRSSHTPKIDTQLNVTMRIVSGTVKSTPCTWLPLLSNIAPPDIRRLATTKREWDKIIKDQFAKLPTQSDIRDLPRSRLKSRHPIWLQNELNEHLNIYEKWNEQLNNHQDMHNLNLVNDAAEPLPGFNLPRKTWSRLNRFRTGHGRCRDMLFKWNMVESSECDCGAPRQTMNHILNSCPLRSFPGGLDELNRVTSDAVKWLDLLDVDV